MRAVLFLAVALAGCGGGASDTSDNAAIVADNASVATESYPTTVTTGWADYFARPPQEAMLIFGRFAMRPGEYVETGDGYASTGIPIALNDAGSNEMLFNTMGTEARLSDIQFELNLRDTATAAMSRGMAAKTVENALPVVGVDGAGQIADAIEAGEPTQGTLDGATYALAREPISGTDGGQKLTLTISSQSTNSTEPRK